MPDKKIIVVMGGTGAQGGGLVRAIQSDRNSPFRARAVTRHAQSDKARRLADLGAEIVEAGLEDHASIERAFKGAAGAFCVTFFWEHMSPEKELAHARTQAQAAKAAGVAHVIWSTLEDTRKWVPLTDTRMPTLMGKYKVPHFDAKGEANHFFTEYNLPVTILLTSFYWDNFILFGMGPKPGPDGTLQLTLPLGDRKLAGIAAEDIGRCAYGIFKRRRDHVGKTIGIAGGHLTGEQMAAAMDKALGRQVRYNPVTPEQYRGFGFPGADDLGNMFQFYRDFETYFASSRKVEVARALDPELQSFDQWLAANASRMPLEASARA
jgi:uncharacterized protein YbjT (DUF2867 family)